MEVVVDGVLIGVIATAGTDVWAAVVKHLMRLPTADWAMIGRWFGHMPKGIFRHHPIAASSPVAHELVIGWIAHYLTGIVYGVAYLCVVIAILAVEPSLASALIFGLVTLVAPWFVMQPAIGAGVFAAKTPRPGLTRMINLSMHAAFGASLYVGWLVIR